MGMQRRGAVRRVVDLCLDRRAARSEGINSPSQRVNSWHVNTLRPQLNDPPTRRVARVYSSHDNRLPNGIKSGSVGQRPAVRAGYSAVLVPSMTAP